MSDALPDLTPEEIDDAISLCVSRETCDKLQHYASLLAKWQKTINLVSQASLKHAWQRHFLDSLQLLPLLGNARTLVDLGSGGGFPGLVLAAANDAETHLVESDQRKAAFLRTVKRDLALTHITIHAERIENAMLPTPDVITARALAPLQRLHELSERIRGPKTQMLFLKGKILDQELTESQKFWHIAFRTIPSATDSQGRILHILEAERDH